jgi:hypothetical protein
VQSGHRARRLIEEWQLVQDLPRPKMGSPALRAALAHLVFECGYVFIRLDAYRRCRDTASSRHVSGRLKVQGQEMNTVKTVVLDIV